MAGNSSGAAGESATGQAGLLIIDMINDLDFPGGDILRPKAEAAAEVVRILRRQAERAGAPVIYVNDNYGQWHSEKSKIVDECRAPRKRGRALVDLIAPDDEDYFVIKPQFSGFYATNLPALLANLGSKRLILTGIAADICVLFTAADAHMRGYDLWIPRDGVASEDERRTDWALAIMRDSMGAEVRPTSEFSFEEWVAASTDENPDVG